LIDLYFDVVILSYNSEKYLDRCIESCLKQTHHFHKIIIIDNNSEDMSREIIEKFSQYHPSITTVFLNENTGFSKGMNIGISLSTSDWVLCLNSDMYLNEYFIESAAQEIYHTKDIGSVCGKVYRWDPPHEIDSVGNTLNYRFTLKNEKNTEDQRFVFGANGCSPLYKRKMLEEMKVGSQYFDEKYFAYMEDTDLAWRAYLGGWKTLYIPRAVAWHKRSAVYNGKVSFWSKPFQVRYLVLINRYRTILKNFNLISLFLLFPYFLVSETFLWSYLILRSKEYFFVFFRIIKQLIHERNYLIYWKNQLNMKRKKSYLSVLKHIR